MDILTHAIVGAATGALFDAPVAGAVIACTPDLVLGFRRRSAPSKGYRGTHSALFLLAGTVAAWAAGGRTWGLLWFWCVLSHICLDIPTHGTLWAPRLFYPFSDAHLSCFREWEFGDETWTIGLILSCLWVLATLWLAVLAA